MALPDALPGRRQRQVDGARTILFESAIAEFRPSAFRASAWRASPAKPECRGRPTREQVLLELQWLEEHTVASRLEHARSLREALHELAEGLIALEARFGDADLFRDMIATYARGHGGLPIDEQSFPIVDALTRHFEEAAVRGELRAGLEAEAAARVCLTRSDFGLLFSLYLAEEAR